MRMLMVVPWDKEPGGVVTIVNNLARHLQDQGHEVFFFHPGSNLILQHGATRFGFRGVQLRLNLPFGEPPHRILRTLAFPGLFLLSILQLVWFIRSRGIQLVNVHYAADSFVYFAVCRRLLPLRLVTSIHGNDLFPNGKSGATYSAAFKFLLRSSDRVVLPSDAYRKRFREIFPPLAERALFIHNGINPEQFNPQNPGKSGGGIRYILCIAALVEWKGIDVLLRGAQPLLQADSGLRLYLVGDGPLRTSLADLALSLGIDRQTEFLGTREGADIANLLHGCEIFVLPSRAESFGLVVIEALACRKPVVATAVGGIPEIIQHEKNGLLVEPGNVGAMTAALRRLLADTGLAGKLAANGYATLLERFCFKHTGAAYGAMFESLLSAGTPPHSPGAVSATRL